MSRLFLRSQRFYIKLKVMGANALDVVERLFDPDRFMENLFVELEKRTTT